MNRITEMVEAEASQAEAENPDEETEEEEQVDEEERAAEQEHEPTEAEPEQLATLDVKALERAEKAIEAQRRKLGNILGDENVAHTCILCAGLGFTPVIPEIGTEFLYTETENGPELMARPPQPPLPYVQAPDKQPCDRCGALGQYLSGSKNPNHELEQCSKCQGNGWVMKALDEKMEAPPVTVPVNGGAPVPQNPYLAVNDPWDRPIGHPHYGLPPSAVGV